MVHDPVCLMELDSRQAAAMVEYQGRAYYFCSGGCRQTFLSQPSCFMC